MKKASVFIITFLFILSFYGCKQEGEKTQGGESEAAQSTTALAEINYSGSLNLDEAEPAKIAVVYFSFNDRLQEEAEYIAKKTGGSILRLETEISYPEDEALFLEQIKKEREKNIRPAIKNRPEQMSSYDIIFFGYPLWDNSLPMVMHTFLEDYDMRDKAFIPFCLTQNGSFGDSMELIASICAGSILVNPYPLSPGEDISAASAFNSWIDRALYGE